MAKKAATAEEKKYLNRIVELGCIVCRTKLGLNVEGAPCCVHHLRDGYGVSQRAPHFDAIGLCYQHHQGGYGVGFHAGKLIWEANFGTERELQAKMHDLYREEYGEEPLGICK